jgi:hypothetical protein
VDVLEERDAFGSSNASVVKASGLNTGQEKVSRGIPELELKRPTIDVERTLPIIPESMISFTQLGVIVRGRGSHGIEGA